MPRFFFFNDPPTTEIYTLSLHDALPISVLTFFLALNNGVFTESVTKQPQGATFRHATGNPLIRFCTTLAHGEVTIRGCCGIKISIHPTQRWLAFNCTLGRPE